VKNWSWLRFIGVESERWRKRDEEQKKKRGGARAVPMVY